MRPCVAPFAYTMLGGEVMDEMKQVSDPELQTRPLDLARPELAEVMRRYEEPVADPENRTILVMGRSPDLVEPLVRSLHARGWSVVSCEGPSSRRCPLVEGRGVCDKRAVADATIAFVNDRGGPPSPDLALRLRCAGDGNSPVVLALEGRVDPPRITGKTEVVGALRGPGTIVAGCTDLLRAQGP